MNASRRSFLAAMSASLAAWRCSSFRTEETDNVTRYVRYEARGNSGYGILRGENVHPIAGDLFGSREASGEPLPAAGVKLLYPILPKKILALAGNYRSHLGNTPPAAHPEPFYKPISCLQNPEGEIFLPEGFEDVHYEAELVIVIGKLARKASVEQASECILGYTCGNDVSERNWQNGSIDGPEKKDLQWWRAKGSETFGPLGPCIAAGLDLEKSSIRLRLNSEVKQEAALSDLIHKPAETVSYISQYVTLEPGDLIFTGTSGTTSRMKSGDMVEVEIDGIGVLRNHVA